MKLDSIESAATVAMDTDPDLFCLKEEKPVMTFGIADFPSLGFREGVGPSPDKAMDASRTPFGALSNLMSMLGVNAKEVEQPGVCGGDKAGRRGVGGGWSAYSGIVSAWVWLCISLVTV